MNQFLTNILETKRVEVARLRTVRTDLHRIALTMPPTRAFADSICRATGLAVVSEIKKASPSKGVIRTSFDPVEIARTYRDSGADAISVLTDETYFQGSIAILKQVRDTVNVPVLRKDFIIDEVQVMEARVAGADAILLICAALTPQRLTELSSFSQSLGMDVLIEVHAAEEIEAALSARPSVIGINNRNLHTFEVKLETTETLISAIPSDIPVIAESGIFGPTDAERMAMAGARGILVGESLMRLPSPEAVADAIHAFQASAPLLPRTGRG